MSPSVVVRRCAVAALVLCLLPSFPATAEDPASGIQARIEHLREQALRLGFERDLRVLRVTARIRVAGAKLCRGKVSPVLGVIAATKHQFPGYLQDAAARLWGIDDQVRVLWVEPGYPAAEAGVRAGDVVRRIDGHRLHRADVLYSRHAGSLEGPFEFAVLRDGEELSLRVPYRKGCFSAGLHTMSPDVNAYVSLPGGRMYVTSGMLRFIESDDELAVVVGHEIAHHVLGYWEADADYLGCYLAALAGFDVSVAPAFWHRMGIEHPWSLDGQRVFESSHPGSPERSLALAETLREIAEKRERGEPLVPRGFEP